MRSDQNSTGSEIIVQMRQLIQILAKHSHAYYVMDQPSISDAEYDQLFHQLKDLEARHPEYIQSDSPTQKVGGEALKKFQYLTVWRFHYGTKTVNWCKA